jgi:hypothetical protein
VGATAVASVVAPSAADCFAATLFAGFFSGFGSSGCSSRVRPSRWARRRTMSEYASLSDEEWLFTGTPRTPQRSITSALVIPSSLASS